MDVNIERSKLLLVGSGWYVKDWWQQIGTRLNFSYVIAINNAMMVTKEKTTHWYIPSDFIFDKKYDLTSFKNNRRGLNITSYFIEKPYWYWDANNGTMILNCLYDILNRAVISNYKVELYIIGCDLIYNKEINHFYGVGTPDPLRIGEQSLKNHLLELKSKYESNNCVIKNLSTYETLLPFDRINISELNL